MKTPESIRLSLQIGEWVTCLDFSDANCHIPMRVQGVPQIPLSESDLPVHSPTFWPIHIQIHQYLDNFLTKAKDKQTCNQDSVSPHSPLGDRLGNQPLEIRTSSSIGLQFRRVLIQLRKRIGQIHPRKVGGSQDKKSCRLNQIAQ